MAKPRTKGMKRPFNIMMALMLSLMVVYMGVGTTVIHCACSDKIMVGAVEDCCQERSLGHDCCHRHQHGAQVKKHCMDVKLVKLPATLSAQKMDSQTAPPFAGILPSRWLTLPRPVISSIQKARLWNRNVPHSPPRAYLKLLNTLII